MNSPNSGEEVLSDGQKWRDLCRRLDTDSDTTDPSQLENPSSYGVYLFNHAGWTRLTDPCLTDAGRIDMSREVTGGYPSATVPRSEMTPPPDSAQSSRERQCGATYNGHRCVLAAGHNRGQADIQTNHYFGLAYSLSDDYTALNGLWVCHRCSALVANTGTHTTFHAGIEAAVDALSNAIRHTVEAATKQHEEP